MILRILILCCLYFPNCYAQSPDNAIFIAQSAIGGFRGYNYIIAKDEKDLEKTQTYLKVDGLFLKKCILDDETYRVLQTYVQKNCVPINTENSETYNSVLIRCYTKRNEQICYLVDKREIELYFNTLKTQINTSQKDENKALLEMFDQILNIVKYDPRKVTPK